MRDKLIRFMMGRYGIDNLNNCLLWSSLVLLIIATFTRLGLLTLISYVLMIIVIYRMLSRKIYQRENENKIYLEKTRGIRHYASTIVKNISDKQYKYFVCPGCGKIVRVPRGKGVIEITCPTCQKNFDAKS